MGIYREDGPDDPPELRDYEPDDDWLADRLNDPVLEALNFHAEVDLATLGYIAGGLSALNEQAKAAAKAGKPGPRTLWLDVLGIVFDQALFDRWEIEQMDEQAELGPDYNAPDCD